MIQGDGDGGHGMQSGWLRGCPLVPAPDVYPALMLSKRPYVRQETCQAGLPHILNTTASYTAITGRVGRTPAEYLTWESQ
jgi:hypothetical protein